MPITNKAVLDDPEYNSAMARIQGAMIYACQILAEGVSREEQQKLAQILERICNDPFDPGPDYLPTERTDPATYQLPT